MGPSTTMKREALPPGVNELTDKRTSFCVPDQALLPKLDYPLDARFLCIHGDVLQATEPRYVELRRQLA